MLSGRNRDPDHLPHLTLGDTRQQRQCYLDGEKIQTVRPIAKVGQCRAVSMPSGRRGDPDRRARLWASANSAWCQCHLDGREIQT